MGGDMSVKNYPCLCYQCRYERWWRLNQYRKSKGVPPKKTLTRLPTDESVSTCPCHRCSQILGFRRAEQDKRKKVTEEGRRKVEREREEPAEVVSLVISVPNT